MKNSSNYRILGIDPGTAIVGWGVVDIFRSSIEVVAYGDIRTSKDDKEEDRLLEIGIDFGNLIETYKPNVVSIEKIFYFKNQKTVISVAQARGVIVYISKNYNIPVYSYTPLQIKQSLTGYGKADKKQMQAMVQKKLNLPEIPKPDDTADALAVAVCHDNFRRFASLVQKSI